jgi:DNA-binding NarL/FixJ family response regulator
MRVLIFSMHEESDYAVRAVRAGALGYLVKHEAIEKIERALQEVFAGRLYLSPSVQQARAELGATKLS